jgi:hypothetical protein
MNWDYHTISAEADIRVGHLNELLGSGWTLLNVEPPPKDGSWKFHFRRPQSPSAAPPAPASPLRGGIDGTGPRFRDLIGSFADAVPISLRRRRP